MGIVNKRYWKSIQLILKIRHLDSIFFTLPSSLSWGYPHLYDPPFGSYFEESDCLLIVLEACSRGLLTLSNWYHILLTLGNITNWYIVSGYNCLEWDSNCRSRVYPAPSHHGRLYLDSIVLIPFCNVDYKMWIEKLQFLLNISAVIYMIRFTTVSVHICISLFGKKGHFCTILFALKLDIILLELG